MYICMYICMNVCKDEKIRFIVIPVIKLTMAFKKGMYKFLISAVHYCS